MNGVRARMNGVWARMNAVGEHNQQPHDGRRNSTSCAACEDASELPFEREPSTTHACVRVPSPQNVVRNGDEEGVVDD